MCPFVFLCLPVRLLSHHAQHLRGRQIRYCAPWCAATKSGIHCLCWLRNRRFSASWTLASHTFIALLLWHCNTTYRALLQYSWSDLSLNQQHNVPLGARWTLRKASSSSVTNVSSDSSVINRSVRHLRVVQCTPVSEEVSHQLGQSKPSPARAKQAQTIQKRPCPDQNMRSHAMISTSHAQPLRNPAHDSLWPDRLIPNPDNAQNGPCSAQPMPWTNQLMLRQVRAEHSLCKDQPIPRP
jgi:hypothetical protein